MRRVATVATGLGVATIICWYAWQTGWLPDQQELDELGHRAWEEPTADRTGMQHIENAQWMRTEHAAAYRHVGQLGWVRDGLSNTEEETLKHLFQLNAVSPEAVKAMRDRDWPGHKLSKNEANAVRWLASIGARTPQRARDLADMPFMRELSETGALMLQGMARSAHRGYLDDVMNTPAAIQGLREHHTLLYAAATAAGTLERTMTVLQEEMAHFQSSSAGTTRTPGMSITAVRTGQDVPPDTTTTITRTVAHAEDEMGAGLPSETVIVLLEEPGNGDSTHASHVGHAISQPRAGEEGTYQERASFAKSMAHETAHYFWQGNEDWIDEGISDTFAMTYVLQHGLPVNLLTAKGRNCTAYGLREASERPNASGNKCSYTLGRALFTDLREKMGPERFGAGLRKLHTLSLEARRNGEKAGIEEVRTAFKGREYIIDRHWNPDGEDQPPEKTEMQGTRPWAAETPRAHEPGRPENTATDSADQRPAPTEHR